MKILTYGQLRELKGVPYTRRHLRDLIAAGKFPKEIKLAPGGRIAWDEAEVDQWLADKAAQRAAQ